MLPFAECTCTDFVNANGLGDCGKDDTDFGGSVSCYVNQPASCSDLKRSDTDADKLRSAEACTRGNRFVYFSNISKQK